MRALAMAATVCMACAAPAKPRPIGNVIIEAPRPVAEQAARAFAKSVEPGIYVPRDNPRFEQRRLSVRLYAESCAAGDLQACWWTSSIVIGSGIELQMAATARLRAGCLAGDQMSCRVQQGDFTRDLSRDEPGWVGRSMDCLLRSSLCDAKAVEAECAAGFPSSCLIASELSDPNSAAAVVFKERALRLARDGCRAGIADECEILLEDGDTPADRVLGGEQACAITVESCRRLAKIYIERAQRHDAVRVLELACQLSAYECLPLAERYLRGELPEPVPGRGRALLHLECENSDTDDPDLRDRLCQGAGATGP